MEQVTEREHELADRLVECVNGELLEMSFQYVLHLLVRLICELDDPAGAARFVAERLPAAVEWWSRHGEERRRPFH
jgi:hypothetical protein